MLVNASNSLSIQTDLPEVHEFEHPVGQLGHNRGVCLHTGSEEGGLNKLPLSLPKRALARNESVSEHRLERPCSEVLDVVLGIRHQHLLNKVRPARQIHKSVDGT